MKKGLIFTSFLLLPLIFGKTALAVPRGCDPNNYRDDLTHECALSSAPLGFNCACEDKGPWEARYARWYAFLKTTPTPTPFTPGGGCDPTIYDSIAEFKSDTSSCPPSSCHARNEICDTGYGVCAICWPKIEREGKGCGEPCQNSAECGWTCPNCEYHYTAQGRVCQSGLGLIPATPTPPPPPLAKLEEICKQVPDNPDTPWNENAECIACVTGQQSDSVQPPYPGKAGAWTALGCIPTDFSSILKDYVFPTGIGIAGGIAFLMILFGGFTILTSAGNPERVAKGKELITSALAGLLLIIFSVFILRLIGVEILKIPGFE